MTLWGQGEPDSSRIRRARGVLAIVLARDLVGCHRMRTCVHCKPRNHGRATRHRTSLRAATHSGSTFTLIDTEQLASTAPSHSTSADKHLRTPTGGRENGAEASLGRKGVWGGSEGRGERGYGPGADRRLGRTGVWGGSEPGAEGSMAEASMGRKRVWGGREYGAQGTPRHTDLHFDPQATTFLSPPGGIYLRPVPMTFSNTFLKLKLKL